MSTDEHDKVAAFDFSVEHEKMRLIVILVLQPDEMCSWFQQSQMRGSVLQRPTPPLNNRWVPGGSVGEFHCFHTSNGTTTQSIWRQKYFFHSARLIGSFSRPQWAAPTRKALQQLVYSMFILALVAKMVDARSEQGEFKQGNFRLTSCPRGKRVDCTKPWHN